MVKISAQSEHILKYFQGTWKGWKVTSTIKINEYMLRFARNFQGMLTSIFKHVWQKKISAHRKYFRKLPLLTFESTFCGQKFFFMNQFHLMRNGYGENFGSIGAYTQILS